LYYISATLYKGKYTFTNLIYVITKTIGKYIFTNLIQVTTRATRSIMATVLETALTAIHVVLSFSVQKERMKTIIIVQCKLNLKSK